MPKLQSEQLAQELQANFKKIIVTTSTLMLTMAWAYRSLINVRVAFFYMYVDQRN